MTDQVVIALIGAGSSTLLSLIAAVFSYANNKLGHQNTTAIAATKETIAVLEKNTNSIKDALVKVTGESEFAKGLKVGSEAKGPILDAAQLEALLPIPVVIQPETKKGKG